MQRSLNELERLNLHRFQVHVAGKNHHTLTTRDRAWEKALKILKQILSFSLVRKKKQLLKISRLCELNWQWTLSLSLQEALAAVGHDIYPYLCFEYPNRYLNKCFCAYTHDKDAKDKADEKDLSAV